jgi:excinuclease ABC subunit C
VDLRARADSLPTEAGVYLFRSRTGKVLYVGKAQNLRGRVRQYLSGGDGRHQIPALMDRAADVEVVVTPTIKEALLLENELIKRHKPVFNVRLRDDKQYLTLRLDEREDWPRLTTARRFGRDGARYFGPYTSSVALKESLSNLRRIFPLRSCTNAVFRDYQRRKRPCIEYEMKRCLGPCVDRVDAPGYRELVEGTILFLRGRSSELVGDLQARMRAAAEQQDYEQAARLRDRIQAVERTVERQQIVSENRTARDVFGLARSGSEVEVQVLHVREGRVIGTEGFGFSDVRIDDGEVMGSFVGQYYAGDERAPPREILTSREFPDTSVLEEWLGEQSGGRVAIRSPQRGGLKQLVAMASNNATLSLARRLEARESVDVALAEVQEQ